MTDDAAAPRETARQRSVGTDDRECAADGCEGIATVVDPFCTPECAEGRCPNCGEPNTTPECVR